MDVELGSVPVEQARIARHALQVALGSGVYMYAENYDAARLAVAWIDYKIDRAEFEAVLLRDDQDGPSVDFNGATIIAGDKPIELRGGVTLRNGNVRGVS